MGFEPRCFKPMFEPIPGYETNTGKKLCSLTLGKSPDSLGLPPKIVKTTANLSAFSLFCKQKSTVCVSLINLAMYLVVAVGILRERVRSLYMRLLSSDCSD